MNSEIYDYSKNRFFISSKIKNKKAIMSNGPARSKTIDHELQSSGELIGDPYEISRIRKEDYDHHQSKTEYEDLVQANTKPSVAGARGHQGPAAFLIMASGLDQVSRFG